MTSDDDENHKTPPRGSPSPRERREHARRYQSGIPVVQGLDRIERDLRDAVAGELSDEISSAVDMYEAPLEPEEVEIVRRIRRDSKSPNALLDRLTDAVGRLTHKLDRERRQQRSSNQERANQFLELLDRVPGEQASALRAEFSSNLDEIAKEHAADLAKRDARIRKLEFRSTIGVWIFRAIMGGVGGVLLWAATQIESRAEQKGEMAIRMQNVEASGPKCEARIEAVRAEFREALNQVQRDVGRSRDKQPRD